MNTREFLERLEQEDMLLTINEELDPRYEISAVLSVLGKRKATPAALFNKVKGYDFAVCGNLLNGDKKLSVALGANPDTMWEEYEKRVKTPIAPVLVGQGPVQDIVVQDIDIQSRIPVLTYHEKDVSPYITQGVTFLKDPITGQVSMGVHRLQVKGKDRLGFYLSAASVSSAQILKRAKDKGVSVPVAVVLGAEPAVLLACYSIGTKGKFDKLHLAGGLAGSPIDVIKAETCDLEVPANSMFVLEGEIPPGLRDVDGPFGEVLGYYISGEGFVVDVKLITHQKDPIYSVAQPFSYDDHIDTMMKMQIEAMLKMMIPNLVSIGYHFPSCLVVLSIRKQNPWDSRSALYTCLNALVLAKYVIVVDDDVDPNNLDDVAFALAGRCQPEKDLVIINDVLGLDLDPSLKAGSLTSKIGLDATRPLDETEKYEKARVPRAAMDKAQKILKDLIA